MWEGGKPRILYLDGNKVGLDKISSGVQVEFRIYSAGLVIRRFRARSQHSNKPDDIKRSKIVRKF